jgi:hypothetical protein
MKVKYWWMSDRFEEPLKYLEHCIENFPSGCIRKKQGDGESGNDGDLIGWVISHSDGSIGILRVLGTLHKKLGLKLAMCIFSCMCRENCVFAPFLNLVGV